MLSLKILKLIRRSNCEETTIALVSVYLCCSNRTITRNDLTEHLSLKEVKSMGQNATLKIEGMTCGHCKAAVEKSLKSVPGVTNAAVDLEKKEAVITGSANRSELVKAVEDAGYSVTG